MPLDKSRKSLLVTVPAAMLAACAVAGAWRSLAARPWRRTPVGIAACVLVAVGPIQRVRAGALVWLWGFSQVAAGAFLRGEHLMLRRDGDEVAVVERSEVRLRGYHNVMNVLAAIALADAVGATPEGMRRAIAAFTGVPHRLELVRQLRGTSWFNDSIATAPERVLAALDSFDEPLVLLAGGRDKDLPWERLAERIVERVRILVLFGEAAPLIGEHVATARAAVHSSGESGVLEDVVMSGTLQGAVEIADGRALSGDVVLLSPGGTSFDAFRDFAERGMRFREWVNQLL